MADIPVVPRGQQQSQPELAEALTGAAPQAPKPTRKSPRKSNAGGEEEGQTQGEGSAAGPGPDAPGEDGEERRFCYCNDVEYGSVRVFVLTPYRGP